MSGEACKACGFCEHWRQEPKQRYGQCVAPVPQAVFVTKRIPRVVGDGRNCQCFREKKP